MGVMNCSRNGCDNIMCSTYIPNVGYICDECQEEFKHELSYESKYAHKKVSSYEVAESVSVFLESEKNSYVTANSEIVDNFFKEHTT